MAEPITWTNITLTLDELDPWPRNPRQIKGEQVKRLEESYDEFGEVEPIAVGPKGENGKYPLYNGHQRYFVLKAKHGGGFEVDARLSSRPLTEKEREKLTIFLHVGATGDFNWDELANWDIPDLKNWGMNGDTLKGLRRDVSALKTMLQADGESDYSRNIEAPLYTPKGEKPAISDLYDDTKTIQLLADIDAADLPEEEKDFLRIAARRHTVLNYKLIAEYYSQSNETIQALMENSALVIIDFNRAIELGYVKLSEEIASQYGKDYPNE